MIELIITVSPKTAKADKKYRLKINSKENNAIPLRDNQDIIFQVGEKQIKLKFRNTKKCPNELDSKNGELNSWIIENSFHEYPNRQPTKLKFKLYEEGGKYILLFQYS